MKTNKIFAMTMAAAMAFSAASSLIAYADDPVTNSIVITKDDTMKSLDLTTLMSDADKANMEKGNNVTVKYVLSFVGSDVKNSQFVDLIGAKAPEEKSVVGESKDSTRYVRTKINDWWSQLDMIGAAQESFKDSNDKPDGENYLQKLNLAGKFQKDESIYSYETELKIDFSANTVTEKTTKLFDYSYYADNSGKEFAFTIGSDVSKSDLTLVAYNNFNANTNIAYTISDISVEVEAPETPETTETTVTAEQISARDDLAGANAASYMASFNGFSGTLNTLTWTINKADEAVTKSVPEVDLGGTTISDKTDIVVGLVITTNEELKTIGTVTATLK